MLGEDETLPLRKVLQELWDDMMDSSAAFPELDELLSENEHVDSLTVTDLITGLEERLGIVIPDSFLIEDNVGTMRKLLAALGELMAGRRS